MKKIFSFILVALTLLSCVVFSACGDKYKNMKIRILSSEGEAIERVDFSIENGRVDAQTIKVSFSGIDKGDVGQIKVTSYPTMLIEDVNYRYEGKSCFVNIMPIRSTKNQDAKLIVTHLSSGKQASIGLNIDEKANSLQVSNTTYIVSIPDLEKDENGDYITNNHRLDCSQVTSFTPEASTDKVYFKLAPTQKEIAGVEFVKLENETYDEIDWVDLDKFDLYTGFNVTGLTVNDTTLSVYPVTVYRNKVNIIGTSPINIKFKKVLTQSNLRIVPIKENCADLDLSKLELIANDNKLQSIILQLNYVEKVENGEKVTPLIDTDFFDMYDIVPSMHIDSPLNIIEDKNKDVVVQIQIRTDNYESADIQLVPKNYVGDFETVSKTIGVKGELKANGIALTQNGKNVENQKFDIFNYYSEGNALGTEFLFSPYANSREPVNTKLKRMRIVIEPSILFVDDTKEFFVYQNEKFSNEERYINVKTLNDKNGVAHGVNSEKYSLIFHKFSAPLKFYFDTQLGKMVSETFVDVDKIFVKSDNEKTDITQPTTLAFDVETVNDATNKIINTLPDGTMETVYEYPQWADLQPTTTTLEFNRSEGIYSMSLAVGTAKIEPGQIKLNTERDDSGEVLLDVEPLYLDVSEDLTNKFYYTLPWLLVGVNGEKISEAKLSVEVVPKSLEHVTHPLTIRTYYSENTDRYEKGEGSNFIQFDYQGSANDCIEFVYDENTTVGEYDIIFKQGDEEKARTNIIVYEDLKSFSLEDNLTLKYYGEDNDEDNRYIIKNYLNPSAFGEEYQSFDFIVPASQSKQLQLSVVNLPENVIKSKLISSYEFTIEYCHDDMVEYVKVDSYVDANYALLSFLQGSCIEGGKEKIEIKVSLQIDNRSFIGKKVNGPIRELECSVSFFVYERITRDKVDLSETYATRYYKENLGYYHKDLSELALDIEFKENLENYYTDIQWFRTVITSKVANGGATAEFIGKDVTQYKEDGFSKVSGIEHQQNLYVVKVKQFNEVIELRCTVDIKEAILTEKLIIESNVEIADDQNYGGVGADRTGYYIDLKEGESYQMIARNFSNLGPVTFPETIIQVYDENGEAFYAQDYFEVDQETNTITVLGIPNGDNANKKFYLIVFAKDVLSEFIGVDTSGLDNPEGFIMQSVGDVVNRYKKAYFCLEVKLTDGTENHPYVIDSSNDFWQIDDNEAYRQSYWKLTKNITLTKDPREKNYIENFCGSITTENDVPLTISNINLSSASLFKHFYYNEDLNDDKLGTIKNIKFIVNYSGSRTSDSGLFDSNRGKLIRVGATISGSVNLKSQNTAFGGLVGRNYGDILYREIIDDVEKTSEGVSGTLTVSVDGNITVYIGGLVGINYGLIEGCEPEPIVEDGEEPADGGFDIVFQSTEGTQNALSEITLTVNSIDNKNNKNSRIGGVVGGNNYDAGLNLNGIVRNAFVHAVIDAQNFSNVGGVIGENIQQATTNICATLSGDYINGVDIPDYDDVIFNVKSTAIIKANTNVGGIVGSDTNGVYAHCDFQILSEIHQSHALEATSNVGGIAGYSKDGKFFYCSTMSYVWNYSNLDENNLDLTQVIDADSSKADIFGGDYVGGIVGCALTNGNDSTLNDVIIAYSSVNAYLVSGNNKNIGGLACVVQTGAQDETVFFNGYFIGKLEGNVHYSERRQNVSIANMDERVLFNQVYSIVLEEDQGNIVKTLGAYNNAAHFDPAVKAWSYWGKITDLNGNYIFVTSNPNESGSKPIPIFDISPQKITVTVDESKQKTNTNDYTKIENVLFLDYYDFSQNTKLTEDELKKLDNHFNRNKTNGKLDIKNLFDFTVVPSNLGKVVIKVSSDNRKVINVSQNGYLEVMGVGECELTFSSVLNPAVNETIKVVVDYPIGNEFQLSTNKADKTKVIEGTTSIALGFSQQYYVVTSGEVEYNGLDVNNNKFAYRTQDNPHLKVNISLSGVTISDYLRLEGSLAQNITETPGKLSCKLTNDTPFVVSVKKKLDDGGSFTCNVSPYIMTNYKGVSYQVDYNLEPFSFSLSTAVGPTNVAFSLDDAIIYPNDLVQIFAHISTDKSLTPEQVFNMLDPDAEGYVITMNSINYTLEIIESAVMDKRVFRVVREEKIDGAVQKYNFGTITITIENPSDGWDGVVQTVEFSIQYERAKEDDNAVAVALYELKELKTELSFSLEIRTEYGATNETQNEATANFTLIPQRINKFDIKNYYYKNVEGGIVFVKEDVLKSNQAGTMQIDLVPDNGYYSYLEISDLTGDQEILFTQVDALEKGQMVHDKDEVSSDGKGIKLNNNDDDDHLSTIYVRTQIDKGYDSKIHTVELRAYSVEGKLLYSQPYYLDIKMLPNIILEYLNPDATRSKLAEADSVDGVMSATTAQLANGVDAEFRIKVENANTDLVPVLSSSDDDALAKKYEFIHIVNDYYTLRRKTDVEIDNSDLGKTITLSLSTKYEHENGDVDTAECSITFTITTFVIHGISVNNSNRNQGVNEIYGYVDKEVPLTFYFGKNDISYYDPEQNNHFWDTEYRLKNLQGETDGPLKEIHDILLALNPGAGNGNSSYITLGTEESAVGDITLTNNTLLATNEVAINEAKLQVCFEIKNANPDLDNPKWVIDAVESGDEYVIDKTYGLNFNKATAWYEPKVIVTTQDFLEMESGLNYILANDLEFEVYTPVDLDLLEFDGNGRTITIKKFATFQDEEINAGLFAQVYPNMTVKNVTVEYSSQSELNPVRGGYYDLCNGSANYTIARFGGIAAINNGVITNCHVQGSVKMRASIIEQKKAEDSGSYETNMFIGGIVAENSSTGYITNSTTQLNINSQSNIGGLAYSNQGKIASSGVIDARIYTYNNALGNTIVVRVAGFVVNNMGEVSMSYVKLQNSEKTISAKDLSAGFVYENSGKIYDAYVEMDSLGFNNNVFAGFVYSNIGTVERAFTYINKGVLKNVSDSMFAPRETEGLINCIEFVSTSYDNNIEAGLSQINASARYSKTIYDENNFAFGDNIGAVWSMQSGTMPKLVIESEINKLEKGSEEGFLIIKSQEVFNEETGTTETDYEVSTANYGTKENPYIISSAVDIKDESGKVIIQNTWQLFTGKIKNLITDEVEFIDNSYFRIVKDIDFTAIGNNPETSKMRFSGNIQGNNMVLKNIMLYSVEEQESIGLFKELVGTESSDVENAVRNLTLTTSSVWASRTNAVGVLAGTIENFNLFNIKIDSEGIIMVGGNAVGGVAGVIRGNFNIDSLSSNIGANSNRATGLGYHSIYMSKNNKSNTSENLVDVYYAGSVAGILDGYDRAVFNINGTDARSVSNYFQVKNINVTGNITLIGDLVGAAFGFIGERTYVSKVNVNIEGLLSGYHYSGALAGENRGVIDNKINNTDNMDITFANNIFTNSANVSAGAVGLNIGGLVFNIDVVGNIKLGGSKMAGAIVGRNINGVVANTCYDGEISAFIAAGAVAGDYTAQMYKSKTNSSGAISTNNLKNGNLIPQNRVKYKDGQIPIDNYQNIALSGKAFKYIVDNINKYYIHKKDETNNITYSSLRLFGLIVGLTGHYDNLIVPNVPEGQPLVASRAIKVDSSTLSLSGENPSGKIIFNALGLADEIIASSDTQVQFNETMTDKVAYNVPVFLIAVSGLSSTYDIELFLTGSYTTNADSWMRNYSNDRIIILK